MNKDVRDKREKKMETDKLVVASLNYTSWEEGKRPVVDGQLSKSEIIEFGICLLDVKTREITDNDSWIVKPENVDLSLHCQNYTLLKKEDVEKGIPLVDVCSKIIDKYQSRRRAWATWGTTYKVQILLECRDKNIKPPPISAVHYDVSHMFSIRNPKHKQVKMLTALDILQLGHEGTFRRAKDDALNVARVFGSFVELLQR